jgi:hypothetical protein
MADDQTLQLVNLSTEEIIAPLSNTRVQEEIAIPNDNKREKFMNEAVDPARILDAGFGFWSSKVLLTAIELEVFTVLNGNRMTGEELGNKLGLHPRGIWDFFDTLVALKFLERDGNGREAL